MSTVQRRIGPLVIGFYGIFSSIINGLNLMIMQFRIPKSHLSFGFNYFPLIFFSVSIFGFSINYPFFFFDGSFSLLVFGIVSFFGIVFLILSAFAGLSKYNLLGCIRLISQLLSYELVWSTIILFFIISWNNLSISSIFQFSGLEGYSSKNFYSQFFDDPSLISKQGNLTLIQSTYVKTAWFNFLMEEQGFPFQEMFENDEEVFLSFLSSEAFSNFCSDYTFDKSYISLIETDILELIARARKKNFYKL